MTDLFQFLENSSASRPQTYITIWNLVGVCKHAAYMNNDQPRKVQPFAPVDWLWDGHPSKSNFMLSTRVLKQRREHVLIEA